MIIEGVLLGTIEEQVRGGDRNPIDPNLLRLTDEVPVSIGFQSDRVIGKTTKVWREGGRVLFRATVDEMLDFTIPRPGRESIVDKGAIGFMNTAELAYDLEMKDLQKYTVKGGKLFEVGLTDENENRNQPPFVVIEK